MYLLNKEKALGGKYHRQTIIYINPKPFLMRMFQKFILTAIPSLQKCKTKVERITKNVSVLFFASLLTSNVVTAQSKLWLHGNKVINLSDSYNITVSNLPTPTGPSGLVYNGDMPTLTEHVEYDSNGNILFFMIDGKIYNKDGYLLVQETMDEGSLYEYYPEKALNHVIIKVPGECNKFYILQNLNETIDAPLYWDTPRFFISVLDLDLSNMFFPIDPDKRGALVNWESTSSQYPIALLNVQNASQAPGFHIVNARCGSIVSVTTSIPGNPNQNSIAFTQFTAHWVDETQVLLNESKYGSSFNWILNAQGLKFIEGNLCTASVNNVTNYYEKRSISAQSPSVVNLFMGRRNMGSSTVSTVNNNFQEITCNWTLPASNVLTSESSANGTYFYVLESTGGLKYINLNLGTSFSIPNSSVPNINTWLKGCHFRRGIFEGTESIYVFHEDGVDVIKGINNPMTLSVSSFVINLPSPLATNAILISALNSANSNFNYPQMYASSVVTNATSLVIAPIQVYNRFDEIISTSECCVFETNYNAEGNITVNSNQTWSPGNNPFNNSMGPIHISGDITIPNGRLLQINQGLELRFDENASIRVLVGGKLSVNNAKLTSYACEGRMWQGIDVFGPGLSSNIAQTTTTGGASGVVHLMNDAVIENALIGIEVGQSAINSGGVVQVLSGRFTNNEVGIKFQPYHFEQNGSIQPNKSYIQNCMFETISALKNENLTPKEHIDLNGVVKLKIQHCNFQNTTLIEAVTLWEKRGIGIRSFNSSFSCKGNPEMDYSFVNLTNGISQINFGSPIASFVCTGMHFNGCFGGIVNIASNNIEVYGNKFTINQIDAVDMQEDALETGIYCIGSTGYSIEQNVFEGVDTALDTGDFPSGQGVRINGSGPAGNKVRNNDFSNLLIGIHAEKKNMDPNALIQTGLQFLCNDFVGDKLDIYRDVFATIRQDQGGNQPQSPLPVPAYNRFSEVVPNCSTHSDFLISPSNIDYTNYFHNGQEIQIPNCVTNNGAINLLSNSYVPDVAGACSNSYTIGSPHFNLNSGIIAQHRGQIGVLRTQLQDKVALYEQVVDKNQRVSSLTLIETAFPNESEFVKNLLLQRYPLSDEVIKRLIQHASKFEAWHLTQVFVANSPLDKRILAEIEQTGILSPFFMTFIYNANDNPGATLRKMMEMDITNTASQIDELSFDISKHVLHQYDFSIDSSEYAIPLYELSGVTLMSSEEDQLKLQAALKLFNGQNASDEFAALNMSTEEINILNMALLGVQDSTSIALLESYLQHSNEVVAQQADILLDYLNHSSMIPPTQLPIQYRSLFTTSESNKTVEKLPLMGASPNPANNYCYIHYPIEADGLAVLSVVDIQGREIMSTALNHNGLIEMETSDLENGVYIGRLVVDGKLLETIKITVLH